MSVDILRRAATLMRERAEAATPGRWEHIEAFNASFVCFEPQDDLDTVAATKLLRADNRPGRHKDKRDAKHIASWHPAAALAVVPLLLALADRADEIADSIGSERVAASVIADTLTGYTEAVGFALTYLGED